MIKNGFFLLPESEAEKVISECELQHWKIFKLPGNLSSKSEFFDGVRLTLPLDPPLASNRSWDALDDSLWSGLDSLLDENILIIWPYVNNMRLNWVRDFEIIREIFSDLTKTISNDEFNNGSNKNIIIVGLI